jgi:hypothetical protein
MDSPGWCEFICVSFVGLLTSDHKPKTPATCANIAIHNLYKGEIDLVVR